MARKKIETRTMIFRRSHAPADATTAEKERKLATGHCNEQSTNAKGQSVNGSSQRRSGNKADGKTKLDTESATATSSRRVHEHNINSLRCEPAASRGEKKQVQGERKPTRVGQQGPIEKRNPHGNEADRHETRNRQATQDTRNTMLIAAETTRSGQGGRKQKGGQGGRTRKEDQGSEDDRHETDTRHNKQGTLCSLQRTKHGAAKAGANEKETKEAKTINTRRTRDTTNKERSAHCSGQNMERPRRAHTKRRRNFFSFFKSDQHYRSGLWVYFTKPA
jgi:hypothetical protein